MKIENDPLKILCNHISDKLGEGKGIKVTRLFLADGTELASIDEISQDLELWISSGAPFKSTSTPRVNLGVSRVRAFLADDEIIFLQDGAITNAKEELPRDALQA